MPIYIVWNKDENVIRAIADDLETAKGIVQDDKLCGLQYTHSIEEYWLNVTHNRVPV